MHLAVIYGKVSVLTVLLFPLDAGKGEDKVCVQFHPCLWLQSNVGAKKNINTALEHARKRKQQASNYSKVVSLLEEAKQPKSPSKTEKKPKS